MVLSPGCSSVHFVDSSPTIFRKLLQINGVHLLLFEVLKVRVGILKYLLSKSEYWMSWYTLPKMNIQYWFS